MTSDPDVGKRAAGQAAADLVQDGMSLGLGTGSTVAFLLDALAERHLDIAGIPTSNATAARCRELGIGLLDPADVARLDLTIDGADEIDPELAVTKGGGGAHVREKVVATMSERFVIIATADKQVTRLGDTFPIPVEVVPFALEPVRRTIVDEGFEVVLRRTAEGQVVTTDNGNHLLDLRRVGGIEDPAVLDVWLATVPGVVTSGLFVDLAERAVLGNPDGSVQTVMRPAE